MATRTKSNILTIDVGGTHVKALDQQHKVPVKFASGPNLTPRKMLAQLKRSIAGWSYTKVSIGCPGPVLHGKLMSDPRNLGRGWAGFDFEKALGCPVKLVNDAAMQAIGSYQGGRMLFLGLGTGLGAALIVDGVLEPMELAHLPYKHDRTYEDYIGLRGLERMGKKKWRRHVARVVEQLSAALESDYVVLGGGNAKLLGELPKGARLGDNAHAFEGGFRLWSGNAPASPLSGQASTIGKKKRAKPS